MVSNVIVVIGSGGMGLPIARRLGVGRQVLLGDYAAANLSTAEKVLTGEGYSITTLQVDISDFTSVDKLAQKAAAMGTIEAIVHTAGVGPSVGSARRVYEIDLVPCRGTWDESRLHLQYGWLSLPTVGARTGKTSRYGLMGSTIEPPGS